MHRIPRRAAGCATSSTRISLALLLITQIGTAQAAANIGRRAAVLSGLTAGFPAAAATARTPLPAAPRAQVDFANFRIGSKVKELATGRTPEQRATGRVETTTAVSADVCAPLVDALQKSDSAALRALYTPGAIVCDGMRPGRPRVVRGPDALGSYLASLPALDEPKLTLLSLAAEGEWDLTPFVHAEYLCEHSGGSRRGGWLLLRTADGWRIDEDIFPLEAPKILTLMQPRRNEFGERYLEFDARDARKPPA